MAGRPPRRKRGSGTFVMLDAHIPDDPRFDDLGTSGVGLFVLAMCLSMRTRGLDGGGVISRRQVERLADDLTDIDRLVEVELLVEVDAKTLRIAGWSDWYGKDEEHAKASGKGGHRTHHENKGIYKRSCVHCVEAYGDLGREEVRLGDHTPPMQTYTPPMQHHAEKSREDETREEGKTAAKRSTPHDTETVDNSDPHDYAEPGDLELLPPPQPTDRYAELPDRDVFDKFWNDYPHRIAKRNSNKAAAAKAWATLTEPQRRQATHNLRHYLHAIDDGRTLPVDPDRWLTPSRDHGDHYELWDGYNPNDSDIERIIANRETRTA